MDEEGFKRTCIKEKEKKGGIHQPFYGRWVADFVLRQEARIFMLGKYLSDKKKSMEAKVTFGDGGGRKYANSQFSNEDSKMHSTGSRLCKIAQEARGESTACLAADHTVTSTVQAAKGCQRQLRLPTTPSRGTCMTACMLHKSQKASSSLSRLAKKAT